LKFDKIGSIFKDPETGAYDIGPLPRGLGGPYRTATEYYRAWAAKNKSMPGATSPFVSLIDEAAPLISKHDLGPFRLVHGDFGHNNVIVDDNFNILSVIDWEGSFVGPAEMAARFPLRNQMYPEKLIPIVRDRDRKILDERVRRKTESRELFVTAVSAEEDRLCVSAQLSASMTDARADVLYLVRMWDEGMPWLRNYQPGVEEGVNAVLSNLSANEFEEISE
jgi:hypothetical protein